MYTIHFVLYTVHYAHGTLFNVKGISWKLNTVYCTLYTLYCYRYTMETVHFTLHTITNVHWVLNMVQYVHYLCTLWTLYLVHCTLFTILIGVLLSETPLHSIRAGQHSGNMQKNIEVYRNPPTRVCQKQGGGGIVSAHPGAISTEKQRIMHQCNNLKHTQALAMSLQGKIISKCEV